MNLSELRKAVRRFNLFLGRGVTVHPEPMYGRAERGYMESLGNRTAVDSFSAGEPGGETTIETFHVDLNARTLKRAKPRSSRKRKTAA